ncbi:hypothetical protein [Rickettsiella endosymbiont of Litargus connexus]|jgi:hypothetical protein|uniref:hypothetical protein n=1 Tax=Rickettsiella endosymbiont of Litargus connexus TaxID=3066237 RepID=UPI00376F30FC
MEIKIKLRFFLKKINLATYPNKVILMKEHEALMSLLDSSISEKSCMEVIKKLKRNQVYIFFKLDKDPEFLKVLIKKILDPSILKAILNVSDINYSEGEKIILEKHLCIINLLSNLADDLKEFIKLSIQKLEEKENFFAEYFKELDRLKVVLLTEEIKIDDIKWFFNTNLFTLITFESKRFSITLTEIYHLMIQDINLSKKKYFNNHCEILLDKKTKEGKFFNYDSFFSILYDKRKSFINDLPKSNGFIFHKMSKSDKLCKELIKLALENRLKHL